MSTQRYIRHDTASDRWFVTDDPETKHITPGSPWTPESIRGILIDRHRDYIRQEGAGGALVVYDRSGAAERMIHIAPCEHEFSYVPTGDDVCRKCRVAA